MQKECRICKLGNTAVTCISPSTNQSNCRSKASKHTSASHNPSLFRSIGGGLLHCAQWWLRYKIQWVAGLEPDELGTITAAELPVAEEFPTARRSGYLERCRVPM